MLELAKGAAKAAADKKAQRIVLQDLRGLSDVCQYQLICSGSNEKQTQAISQNVDHIARKQFGQKAIVIEGMQSGNWILLDYGALIVHVFNDTIRDYYAIDQLWPSAKSIEF